MGLSDFILSRMEDILSEWETFAASLLPAASAMSSLALRDHARQMLEAIAKDIQTPQTIDQQTQKSKGRTFHLTGAPETAAQTHAVLRACSGFDVNQLVAEYRALRASVLRLWLADSPSLEEQVDDMIRFNEAIDQAVCESVAFFDARIEQARDLLLGMLGHDLRSPLNTIITTATYLTMLKAGHEVSEAAARLIRSGASMQALLNDLVDFNRTRLGLGVKVHPVEIDLRTVVDDEVEQIRGAHPSRDLQLQIKCDTAGCWDPVRLQQLLRNLLSNAMFYGSESKPVTMTVSGDANAVELEVSNYCQSIEPDALTTIFDPLKRIDFDGEQQKNRAGLGLGLFIVREIARAHGGDAFARIRNDIVTFAVQLPRGLDKVATKV